MERRIEVGMRVRVIDNGYIQPIFEKHLGHIGIVVSRYMFDCNDGPAFIVEGLDDVAVCASALEPVDDDRDVPYEEVDWLSKCNIKKKETVT